MTDTATQPLPLDIGDYVQVTNKGSKPLVLMYDSRTHVIEPGATRPIPFECSNVYFGDPRATSMMAAKRDNVGRVQFIPDRATEVRRLRTLYDNQSGAETEVLDYPPVEIRDYDGNLITTVLEDPAGDSVTAASVTIDENEQLRQMLARQQQTIDMLAQRLGIDPTSGRDLNPEAAATAEDVEPGANNGEPEDELAVLPEDQS